MTIMDRKRATNTEFDAFPTESSSGGCFSQCSTKSLPGSGCLGGNGIGQKKLKNGEGFLFRSLSSPTLPSKKKQNTASHALLARELNELSLAEREHVFEDVHGIPRTIPEDPEKTQTALLELEDALSKIVKKHAYDRALFLSPKYVQDPKFRLMFLRSQNFDVMKAASHMVEHFEQKLELFSVDKLGRDIKYDDLSEFDRESVHSGALQYLQTKDRAGRQVLLSLRKLEKYNDATNLSRTLWYLTMAKLREDEKAQKNGIVIVAYRGGDKTELYETHTVSKVASRIPALPMRVVGFHYCYNDVKLRPVVSVCQLVIGSHARLRFRHHFGSPIECKYDLATFGIPGAMLPMDDDNNMSLVWHEEYLRHRKEVEAEQTSTMCINGTIDCPGYHDVLLGRGRPFQDFTGNAELFKIVKIHQYKYDAARRGEKSSVSEQIAKIIRTTGGRFLKKTEDGQAWVEVSEDVARDKVAHAFRRKNDSRLSLKRGENKGGSDDNLKS